MQRAKLWGDTKKLALILSAKFMTDASTTVLSAFTGTVMSLSMIRVPICLVPFSVSVTLLGKMLWRRFAPPGLSEYVSDTFPDVFPGVVWRWEWIDGAPNVRAGEDVFRRIGTPRGHCSSCGRMVNERSRESFDLAWPASKGPDDRAVTEFVCRNPKGRCRPPKPFRGSLTAIEHEVRRLIVDAVLSNEWIKVVRPETVGDKRSMSEPSDGQQQGPELSSPTGRSG